MKPSRLRILKALGVCALVGVATLSAQVSHKLIVNVPFDFNVAGQQFDSGNYTVKSDSPNGPVLIRNEQSGAAMYVLAFSAQANKLQETGKLVFNRYGNEYFLSKIWYPGSSYGRELKVSLVEEKLAKNNAQPEETTVLLAGAKHNRR